MKIVLKLRYVSWKTELEKLCGNKVQVENRTENEPESETENQSDVVDHVTVDDSNNEQTRRQRLTATTAIVILGHQYAGKYR